MTPCYEWPSRNAAGYGQIQSGGRKNRRHWYAHRVVWSMSHGDIPPGMVVRHHCDNPSCVRIEHLALGTAKKGEANANAKLTQRDVDEIRGIYAQGRTTQAYLAVRFGVGQNHISRIVRGESWQ